MKSHLQKRRNGYYARLVIPVDLRPQLGKTEMIASLKTSDLKVAQAKVLKVIGEWKLGFEALRGSPTALESLAAEIRLEDDHKTDPDAPMSDKDAYIEHLSEELPQDKERLFRDIAMGRATPFLMYMDRFMEQWDVEPKTRDMAKTVLNRVAKVFKSIESVSRPLVVKMVTADTTSPSNKSKNYGFVRQYWSFLQDIGAVDGESKNPFADLKLGTKGKSKAKKRTSFLVSEIKELIDAADSRQDFKLADLIRLAAHTGARIEELCELKVSSVQTIDGIACLSIEDAKTEAGNRLVPIHPDLTKLVKTLAQDTSDGFLITGLKPTKYGDRSNAIGKRFGHLKAALGHGPEKVFHSIRKTVTTLLENAGVPEGVAADIVGHEKATLTYGLYSSGSTTKIKFDAIKKISISKDDT